MFGNSNGRLRFFTIEPSFCAQNQLPDLKMKLPHPDPNEEDEFYSIREQMIGLDLCDPSIEIVWDTPPPEEAQVGGDSFVLLGGKTNPVQENTNLEEELFNYGFTNRQLNKKLISLFAGDVNAIVDVLTSEGDCKWLEDA